MKRTASERIRVMGFITEAQWADLSRIQSLMDGATESDAIGAAFSLARLVLDMRTEAACILRPKQQPK